MVLVNNPPCVGCPLEEFCCGENTDCSRLNAQENDVPG